MQQNVNPLNETPVTPPAVPQVSIENGGIITAAGLQKHYSGVNVLNIDSVAIANGESFGLVGNNGAGKTTFFRLILDLIEASAGEVMIEGEPVARSDAWKQKVGSFLDEGFLIDFLTPDEYFTFTAKLYNKSEGDLNSFLESMQEFFSRRDHRIGKVDPRPVERQPEENRHRGRTAG